MLNPQNLDFPRKFQDDHKKSL